MSSKEAEKVQKTEQLDESKRYFKDLQLRISFFIAIAGSLIATYDYAKTVYEQKYQDIQQTTGSVNGNVDTNNKDGDKKNRIMLGGIGLAYKDNADLILLGIEVIGGLAGFYAARRALILGDKFSKNNC